MNQYDGFICFYLCLLPMLHAKKKKKSLCAEKRSEFKGFSNQYSSDVTAEGNKR